ncbi:hypothetical protein LTR17_023857 [Elasticomyces elasticus]|nr:hypothetical protein LTR17_023857 [Elasticomyces elasticus]
MPNARLPATRRWLSSQTTNTPITPKPQPVIPTNNGRTTLRLRQHGQKSLPLPPLMDPLVLAATEAHKEKKPYRLYGPKTKMQTELELNPYAQALASPIRQCALTSARLPSQFLQPFTTHLVPPPTEPSKSQSRSAVAEITPDLLPDKTGPRTYVLAQAPILDFLAERKRATQVLMPERSKAWMAKKLGRAASGINPQKDVRYDAQAEVKVVEGMREVVRGEVEKGLRHKYVIPLNTVEELREWQGKEERDWRLEDGQVKCLLSLSDASKETMAELLPLIGSSKDQVTLADFGASWAMMHRGAKWLGILESSRAVELRLAFMRLEAYLRVNEKDEDDG